MRCLAGAVTVLAVTGLTVGTASAEPETRIVGQVTKSNGSPAAGLQVRVVLLDARQVGIATTDSTGSYAIGGLPTFDNRFKIEIVVQPFMRQWVHQKLEFRDADIITVTPGEDTVVNEVLFPTGSIALTASDKATAHRSTPSAVRRSGGSGATAAPTAARSTSRICRWATTA